MSGYFCLTEDGTVFAFGTASSRGSASALPDDPAVALAVRADGYWITTRRGRVTAFDVPNLVGPEGVPTSLDVVDLTLAPGGGGLRALDSSGGVFCFGDAEFHGSIHTLGLDHPISAVALTPTPDGDGYWVLDRSGGVFCFGNARFHGSLPELGIPTAPAVTLLAEPERSGYNILAEDGTLHAFGGATDFGSAAARHPIVAGARTPYGALLADCRGIVYPVGMTPFLGRPVTGPPTATIVDVAWHEPIGLRRSPPESIATAH